MSKSIVSLFRQVLNIKSTEPNGQLSALEYLSIGYNKIEAVPESIGNLRSLKRLDIEGNPLTTLPEDFRKLTSLIELHLGRSQYHAFPQGIKELIITFHKKGCNIESNGVPLFKRVEMRGGKIVPVKDPYSNWTLKP